MFSTRFRIVIITLNLIFLYAGGRLIPPESAPSTSSKMPLSVDDTVKLNPRNQIFRGTEVKSCMPKGFRPRSAPSRFVNYQPLVSVKCSSSKVTFRSKISPWFFYFLFFSVKNLIMQFFGVDIDEEVYVMQVCVIFYLFSVHGLKTVLLICYLKFLDGNQENVVSIFVFGIKLRKC